MALFESLQPFHVELLPSARCADDLSCGVTGPCFTVAVQADDGPHPVGDLALVAMRRGLNLTPLVSEFGGGQHPAELIEPAKFLQHGCFHGVLDQLHTRRAAQRVHHELK